MAAGPIFIHHRPSLFGDRSCLIWISKGIDCWILPSRVWLRSKLVLHEKILGVGGPIPAPLLDGWMGTW